MPMHYEGDLQAGDVVRFGGDSYHTAIVLKNDRKERFVKYGQPNATGSCYGTTCPTIMVGISKWNAPYSERKDSQRTVEVVGVDHGYMSHVISYYRGMANRDTLDAMWDAMMTDLGLTIAKPETEEKLRSELVRLDFAHYCRSDNPRRRPEGLRD
jgi:hypothetical protein